MCCEDGQPAHTARRPSSATLLQYTAPMRRGENVRHAACAQTINKQTAAACTQSQSAFVGGLASKLKSDALGIRAAFTNCLGTLVRNWNATQSSMCCKIGETVNSARRLTSATLLQSSTARHARRRSSQTPSSMCCKFKRPALKAQQSEGRCTAKAGNLYSMPEGLRRRTGFRTHA